MLTESEFDSNIKLTNVKLCNLKPIERKDTHNFIKNEIHKLKANNSIPQKYFTV